MLQLKDGQKNAKTEEPTKSLLPRASLLYMFTEHHAPLECMYNHGREDTSVYFSFCKEITECLRNEARE